MIQLTSKDLPQADRLESVLLAVKAVGNGAKTSIDIANNISGIVGDDRQGRYYRTAAKMLGFITNKRSNAEITDKGKQLLLNLTLSNPLLITSVLNLSVYQRLIPFIEINPQGLTGNDILSYIKSISVNLSIETIERRKSSILAWPKTLGFLVEHPKGKYQIKNNLTLQQFPLWKIRPL